MLKATAFRDEARDRGGMKGHLEEDSLASEPAVTWAVVKWHRGCVAQAVLRRWCRALLCIGRQEGLSLVLGVLKGMESGLVAEPRLLGAVRRWSPSQRGQLIWSDFPSLSRPWSVRRWCGRTLLCGILLPWAYSWNRVP